MRVYVSILHANGGGGVGEREKDSRKGKYEYWSMTVNCINMGPHIDKNMHVDQDLGNQTLLLQSSC